MRSWLVVVVLLSVAASPMLTKTLILEDLEDDSQYSSPIQATISPTSGWISGGEEITITGSGFSDLAFSNITDDGINHQWVETTMDYSDQAGRWNAVAVDSNGHIHVVQIKDESYQIRHSVNDGTGWISNGINTCGSTYCWDIHMVIDDNDHIHLAYTTYTSWDETLVYMNYDGTTWTDTVVSNSAHFGPIGIAVDSNHHPHISYALDGSDQCGAGLRISSYDGSSWSYTNVDQGSNRGCESAIVIDESDNIYIAYQDRSSSKLKIATDKSGSWDSYLVDTGTSPSNLYPGYMTSMVMDGQGQFHIAHFDEKEDDLRYSTGAPNSQWTTTIVESTGHTGRDPSIAVDAADQPHIVYHTWSGQNLKYATFDSVTTNWAVTTMASGADVGEGNSIFIDENGVMHVPFNDATSDVLKYATKSTGLVQTQEISVQFGQHGTVTGTVVNDTTIRVTTPSVATGDTVTISILDKDGIQHQLSSTFQFIDQNDLDSDGVLNENDDCPNDAGTSTQDLTGCPDDDDDGYSNAGDAFPNDSSEYFDTDSDGVGDNSDAFPNDANETADMDGDGVGDNRDLYPLNANEWEDLDGNQIPDNSEASKVEFTTSSEDGKIHLYHIFANNLTLTMTATTSEGYTLVALQSTPNIALNTGGLQYGLNGGDTWTMQLDMSALMAHLPEAFVTGGYIDEIEPTVNFSAHVTGMPVGCGSDEAYWDTEQQATCPDKVASHRTDYYVNFSMMLWNGDDDNDGVANSWDLFPTDANESQDSDGDGIGDFSDLCSGTIESETVDANGCSQSQLDADGDGIVDSVDDFPLDSTQWLDSDGDGYGDNWGDSDWNDSRISEWTGVFIAGASQPDYCPDIAGNSTADGYSGCSDADGNGIADLFEQDETNGTDNTNQTEEPVDTDGDGVSDLEDNCPATSPNTPVDALGCEITESSDEDEGSASVFQSLFSGDSDPVTTTVGISAILLALFTLLQTNAAAAILPDTFRWIQVLRKNSKLTEEERNELTYLQSLVQAYHINPEELAEELVNLKGDITARFTNNQIKKETREKLLILIEELQSSTPNELYQIAHNEAYFGLSEVIDADDRTKLLEEKIAMTSIDVEQTHSELPSAYSLGELDDKGTYWIEWPADGGTWYYRYSPEQDWSKFES